MIVVGALFVPASLACAAEPDRAEIVGALKAWRESFANVQMVYERHNPEAEKRYHPKLDNTALAACFIHYTWNWSDTGATRIAIIRYEGNLDVPSYHEVEGVDAAKSTAFRAVYEHKAKEPPFLKTLFLHATSDSRPKSTTIVQPLLRLWFAGYGKWLDEMLADGAGKLDGFETIDGIKCARLELMDYRIWLDTEHSYLPRKCEWLDNKMSPGGWNFSVAEFGLVDGTVWFPKRGMINVVADPLGHDEWVITDIKINQIDGPAVFSAPTAQTGTAVIDVPRGSSYIAGRATPNENGSPTRAINITPEESTDYFLLTSLGLIGLSTILLILGWTFSRQK